MQLTRELANPCLGEIISPDRSGMGKGSDYTCIYEDEIKRNRRWELRGDLKQNEKKYITV